MILWFTWIRSAAVAWCSLQLHVVLNVIDVFSIVVWEVWQGIFGLNLREFVIFIKWFAAVVKVASFFHCSLFSERKEQLISCLCLFLWDGEDRCYVISWPWRRGWISSPPSWVCPWPLLVLHPDNFCPCEPSEMGHHELTHDALALVLLYLTGFLKSDLLLDFRSSIESCETLLNSKN